MDDKGLAKRVGIAWEHILCGLPDAHPGSTWEAQLREMDEAVREIELRALSLESVRSEALKEAAKMCDLIGEENGNGIHRKCANTCAEAIRDLSPARVAEGEITRLKSLVAEAAKAWLIRYEDEVRDEAEEAPCKNLVAAVDALVAGEDVHSTELRK